ncbi:Uncharacterised protein [Mycobacteroides abscessus subsp. abscessus]|uniref:hypothetical protein n=1 Tax=Mycobacteroides abscessus TaxID=36809 RepID=UPI0009275FA8|nr:hypothetical protein [Mycobacteroides abscessus]SIC62258.1 Uncharacterised protein [Mycobacteroides abscessus subsp. abscessus]SIC93847.1 Uncharacterised protein [Mycobacteroides abscessus subsp. abscessus]SID23055.1 Uncharacterised protein [Mycobacteroides abscessus subsp. abscessus]SID51462.1 Uncharacterised protein [Mycobacteroides abscessus subsp. abscessus]SKT56972.1 Uncharacterised protein [Mycobacteroides abscessus subsp. abscessus]
MHLWDSLTAQAHALLTSHKHLTPSVKLVQSLHAQPPATAAAICSHLDTASKVLPELAQQAHDGDPHALLLAAVLMRGPLRKIAQFADPEGYHTSDFDVCHNETLAIFFDLMRRTDPQFLNSRYLYGKTLKYVIKGRPRTGAPDSAHRVDPHSYLAAYLFDSGEEDRRAAGVRRVGGVEVGAAGSNLAYVLKSAVDKKVITPLDHLTLTTLYLSFGRYSLKEAAVELDAKPKAVERRAQRAMRKLVAYHAQQKDVAA